MLNITNLLKKNRIARTYNGEGTSTRALKRDIPASKEWYNSVYAFDKNAIRFLPAVHNYVFNLLKGYFNMTGKKMEKEINARKSRLIRRSSGRKVWISTPEIKHFSEKINITIYVYNRIYNLYKKNIDILEFKWGPKLVLNLKSQNFNTSTNKVAIKPTIVTIKPKKIVTTEIKSKKVVIVNPEEKLLDFNQSFVPKNFIQNFSTTSGMKFLVSDITENDLKKARFEFPGQSDTYWFNVFGTPLAEQAILNYEPEKNKALVQGTIAGHLNTAKVKSKKSNVKKVIKDKDTFIDLTKKVKYLKRIYPTYLGRNKQIVHTNKLFYIEMIKWLKLDKFTKMNEYKNDIVSLLKKEDKQELVNGLKLLKMERYNYLINQFKKELAYLKFKQKMLFNEFKFSELYIAPLIEFLQSIYKKKIELNIVALKHYYLSSSILTQIIITKMKKAKARGKALKVVDRAISNIRIPALSSRHLQLSEIIFEGAQNVILNNYKEKKQDSLNEFLVTKNIQCKKDIQKLVLKNLENKVIAGIFVKISGRLTKRYKAQRAVTKLRARGTLKNVHSAYRGYSSVLSRGYSNINVEKTLLHSNNRIGAFGLTGWIASY